RNLMTRPFGTLSMKRCKAFVSSERPVASIARGTATTCACGEVGIVRGVVRGVVPPLGVVTAGAEVELAPTPDPPWRFGRDPFDEPLHAPSNSVTAPTQMSDREKRLQSRNPPVDSIGM